MADRSITIRLKADVAQALTGLRSVSKATTDYATQTALASAKQKASFDRVGKSFVVGGALIVGGLLAAVHAAAQFDQAMSTVKANIDDKSAPSLARLRQAALDAGSSTAFSATQAANAENELAKAGVSAADILSGSLHASLVLASAGQIDLETSASILSATLVQFGLHGKDAAHVADLLAAGADKSLGGVTDLGEALKYVGVNADQFGISVDQTVGVLAEFASYGILGSMAGTGLRQVLIGLTQPTDAARATMQKYGISVFDAAGKFVGLDNVAGQLHDKLGGLTQAQQQAALGTIGTARSVTELNILMRDGATGVQKWTGAVNDQGFAAQQAATKLDNLSGDLTKLRNSFNVALIETGQEATGALRGLTQETTNLITAYNNLSPAAKGVVVTVAGLTGGTLLLAGGLILAVPRLVEFGKALQTVTRTTSTGAALKGLGSFLIGPWGLALAAGTVALGLFVKAHIDAAARVNDLTNAIEQDSGALGDNTRQTVVNQLQKQGLLDTARKLGVNLNDLTSAVLGNADAQASVNRQISAYLAVQGPAAVGLHGGANAAEKAANSARVLQDAIGSANGELQSAVQKAKDHADALGKDETAQAAAAQAGHTLSQAVKVTGGQLVQTTFDVTAFDQALKGLYTQSFGVADAQDTLTKGFQDLAAQAKSSGTKITGNSAAAIANRTALRQLSQDAFNLVQAYADTGASSDQVKAKAAEVEKSFLHQAHQILGTHANLTDYKAALDAIPANVQTSVTTTGLGAATQAIRNYKSLVDGVQFGVVADFRAMERASQNAAKGPAHASGTTDAPGGLTKVGERGPEWVYMPEHSRVWPSGQAPTFPGPQQGGGIALTVAKVELLRGGPQDVADALAFTMAARGR